MAQLLTINHLHTNCSMKCRPSLIMNFSLPTALHLEKKPQLFYNRSRSFQRFPTRSFETENNGKLSDGSKNIGGGREEVELEGDGSSGSSSHVNDEYPSGEFVLRMLIAWPWERVKKIRGEISDQLKSRFSSGLSLPQICENFIKAAYDPRISGIYLHIEPLNCGWGKVEEIHRHIVDFKKSGKFIVGYVPVCGEKEYYIGSACEELYAPPRAYFQLYGLTVQASFHGVWWHKKMFCRCPGENRD